jgi:UDP-N-acetylglucosamine pyrophosphorylase
MNIQPITPIIKAELTDEQIAKYQEIGSEAIKHGKLAVCTLAGGQGTRLRTSRTKRYIYSTIYQD